jgi:hypothetical protein
MLGGSNLSRGLRGRKSFRLGGMAVGGGEMNK